MVHDMNNIFSAAMSRNRFSELAARQYLGAAIRGLFTELCNAENIRE